MILLDRSASMGYGDHWARAQDEAQQGRRDGLGGDDRATLVLFDTRRRRGRARDGRSRRARGGHRRRRSVSSEATRYAPALRLAQSLLSRSDRCRAKRPISSRDFQKSGWERQEEIQLPEGATHHARVGGRAGHAGPGGDVGRASSARRSPGEERVTITAGLTNRSATAVTNLPVQARDRRPRRRHARRSRSRRTRRDR